MLFLRLAYRNLWRNRRRTRLTLLAMVCATSLLIFTLAMYDGMLWDMIANATEVIQGHISIAAPGFIDNPQIQLNLLEDKDFQKRLVAMPEVKGVCARVTCFGLLSFGKGEGNKTQPGNLMGISPSEEEGNSRLSKSVIDGKFISQPDSKDILLGKILAKKLDAVVGGEVVFMGQTSDGSIAAEIFNVSGIIETGDNMRDASLALVGKRRLQEALVLEDKIHYWNVFLHRPLKSEVLARKWTSEFTGMECRPWQAFIPQIAALLKMWLTLQIITMTIFYFAVVLIGFNTMYMAFHERMREFAIISAIGLRKFKLAALILLEGGVLSGMAGALGAVLGFGFCLVFFYFPLDLSRFMTNVSYGGTTIQPRIYCVPSVMNVCLPFISMFLIGILVSLFPVWKIFRLRPVEALREG